MKKHQKRTSVLRQRSKKRKNFHHFFSHYFFVSSFFQHVCGVRVNKFVFDFSSSFLRTWTSTFFGVSPLSFLFFLSSIAHSLSESLSYPSSVTKKSTCFLFIFLSSIILFPFFHTSSAKTIQTKKNIRRQNFFFSFSHTKIPFKNHSEF